MLIRSLIIFLTFLVCSLSTLLAQKQANVWYFSNKVGLDFSNGAPKVIHDGAMTSFEGCASISDKDGNLLFYTDGISVWNKKHQVMPHGTGLKGHRSSTQSALIVPKPGDGSTYYLFTADEGGYVDPPNDGIHYSVISMCLNEGLGDVVKETKNTLIYSPSTERLAAVYHANGTDIWIMTHEWKSDRFVAYLLTKDGLSDHPIISAVGEIHPIYDNIDDSIGEMKFSPDGKRVGVAFAGSGGGQVFDFDAASGKVFHPVKLSTASKFKENLLNNAYSIAFSPNSQIVYLACANYSLSQFNLQAGEEKDIVESHSLIPTVPGHARGMQLGLDGKLYMIHTMSDTRYLSVIEKPDEIGKASSHSYFGVDLGKVLYDYGLCLPNFISSYFDPTPQIMYSTTCQDTKASFSLYNSHLISQVSWNFGEPESGATNTSNELIPTHTYLQEGDYEVKATLTLKDGSSKTLHKKVILQAPIAQILGKDTTLCQGDSLVFNLSNLKAICMWQDGFVGANYTIKQAGIYVVEICRNSCSQVDSIIVKYDQPPIFDLGADKVVCDGNPIELKAYYMGASYEWQDGFTDASYKVSKTGQYAVKVTNECGTSYDTVAVLFEESPKVELGENKILCVGDTLHLNAFSHLAQTYSWYEASTTSVLSNLSTLQVTKGGMYVVEVKSENCLSTDTLEVEFEECPEKVFIPNVITPNGDGKNDRFEIKGIYAGRWTLEIFNRYGKIIYSKTGYKNDWDGTSQIGTLFYYYLFNAEKKRKYKGWIQVLR
jgi:gliding motility-associated-like protein